MQEPWYVYALAGIASVGASLAYLGFTWSSNLAMTFDVAPAVRRRMRLWRELAWDATVVSLIALAVFFYVA